MQESMKYSPKFEKLISELESQGTRVITAYPLLLASTDVPKYFSLSDKKQTLVSKTISSC